MKKIYWFLLSTLLFSLSCINSPSNQSGFNFWATEWEPTNEVLCEGSGLRFGNCIARQMSDSTCIGIAKFNGSHVALEIPCSIMFKSALDTIILEEY